MWSMVSDVQGLVHASVDVKMSGESVAFIGVGRGRDGKESVVASVDVSIKVL